MADAAAARTHRPQQPLVTEARRSGIAFVRWAPVVRSAFAREREKGEEEMPKEHSQARVRITNQFRKGDTMIYDLLCEDVRLTLEVTQRANDDGCGEWSVEAHARQSIDKPTIHEPGMTRNDALRAVARSWKGRHGAYGFPELDWEAVSVAMLGVRAI